MWIFTNLKNSQPFDMSHSKWLKGGRSPHQQSNDESCCYTVYIILLVGPGHIR